MGDRVKRLVRQYQRQTEVKDMAQRLTPQARQMGAASIGKRLASMSPTEVRDVVQRRIRKVGAQQAKAEFGILAKAATGATNDPLKGDPLPPRPTRPATGNDPAYAGVLQASGITDLEQRFNRNSQRPVGHAAWGW